MNDLISHLKSELEQIGDNGLMKAERPMSSAQSANVTVNGTQYLNLCANNYLGLADHPDLVAAAKEALDKYGYGMASVRFICGTHNLHRDLEMALARFLGKDDAILYAACFDANGGLFEPLLGPEDAIVSDGLNHASIIDGVRLCKAQRYRYANGDLGDLEVQLTAAKEGGARHILIATDGVFSMDGTLAPLDGIAALAKRFEATLMVDDCHATGFIGDQGRGTHAHFGVMDDVDILTGTLGKALGGAIGGYTAGPQAVIDILRQRSRPYLFSNSLPPAVCAAGLTALDLVAERQDLRDRLAQNTTRWRQGLGDLGFTVPDSTHPITPVMLGDARRATAMAQGLEVEGIYVTAFSYPVVPKGQARIRTQMNAALSDADLDRALAAFAKVGRDLEIIA